MVWRLHCAYYPKGQRVSITSPWKLRPSLSLHPHCHLYVPHPRDQSPASSGNRGQRVGGPASPFTQGTISSSSQCVRLQALGEVGLLGLGQPSSTHSQVGTATAPQWPQGTWVPWCPLVPYNTVLDSGALDDAEPLMFQKIPHDVQPVSFPPS